MSAIRYLAITCATLILAACSPRERVVLSTESDRFRVDIIVAKQNIVTPEGYDVIAGFKLRGSTGPMLEVTFDVVDVDTDLLMSYPNHAWVTSDTLRLSKAMSFEGAAKAEIVIRNVTDHQLALVRVKTSGRQYLVFNMAPASERLVEFPIVENQLNWVSGFAATAEASHEAQASYMIKGDVAWKDVITMDVSADGIVLEHGRLEKRR